jgi:hypothetical protein
LTLANGSRTLGTARDTDNEPGRHIRQEIDMNEASTGQISRTVSLMRGLYARVGRKAGCDVSYVSRIARGERRSAKIEAALGREFRVVLRKLRLMQD